MFRNETNYVLTNGVLLDGTEKMTPQTGRDIYIEGGRIGAVADAAARREGYEVVDLGGQYVLPGLINLHVHLPASGKPKKKASDPKKLVKLITANALTRPIGVKLCEGYAKTELLSGVTPAFALHTATLLNARLAGIDGETGSIEAGKAADLIVCAKDPLADLSALRTLSMVIKDGYRVEHPAPKKLPEVERELDKFL